MKKIIKKILAGVILSTIMLVVGGFCSGTMAQASSHKNQDMPEIMDAHCGGNNQVELSTNIPTHDSVMPCCVGKHDNSEIVTPSVLIERLKFYQISVSQREICALQSTDQKTYASSPSPPEPDILSSSIRLE